MSPSALAELDEAGPCAKLHLGSSCSEVSEPWDTTTCKFMNPSLQKTELDTLALTDSVHQAAAAARPRFRVRAFGSEQPV